MPAHAQAPVCAGPLTEAGAQRKLWGVLDARLAGLVVRLGVIASSPMQTLKSKQLNPAAAQVLYLTEPIDEPALSSVSEFDGKKFVDVTREGLELAGAEADGKKKVCAHCCLPACCTLDLAVSLPLPCFVCFICWSQNMSVPRCS